MPTAKPRKANSSSRETQERAEAIAMPEATEVPPAQPPSGLDAVKHAAAQKTAFQAESLRERAFPALMAAALGLDSLADAQAYQLYLSQVVKDAGAENDPYNECCCSSYFLAHFRIAQRHVGAEHSKDAESVRSYSAAAARLLGELRRTARARPMIGNTTTTKTTDQRKLKVLRAAQ